GVPGICRLLRVVPPLPTDVPPESFHARVRARPRPRDNNARTRGTPPASTPATSLVRPRRPRPPVPLVRPAASSTAARRAHLGPSPAPPPRPRVLARAARRPIRAARPGARTSRASAPGLSVTMSAPESAITIQSGSGKDCGYLHPPSGVQISAMMRTRTYGRTAEPAGQLNAGGDAELAVDVLDVRVDSALGDARLRGYVVAFTSPPGCPGAAGGRPAIAYAVRRTPGPGPAGAASGRRMHAT